MNDIGTPVPPLRGLAVFMGVMTSAWSLNASPAAPGVITLLGVGLGITVAVLALAMRPRAVPDPGAPHGPGADTADPELRASTRPTVFRLAVGAEVLAGVIAVVVIARAGLTDYIQPVIALVVALHFPIFLIGQKFWLHLAAGLVGSSGAGLAIVLLATGTIGPDTARAIAALSLAACTVAYGVVFILALRRPQGWSGHRPPSPQRTAGRKVSA